MVKLFKATDLLFDNNGDKVIKPLKAKVHKEENGNFYLDFECDISYVNDIVENSILVAKTPSSEQAFRVGNVSKTKNKLITKAWHVFYDSENYLIADSYVVDKDCAGAMNHLNDATEPKSPFTMFSDITDVGSYRCVRKSLFEALKVVNERWGGYLIRDNFYIGLNKNIGEDNDVVIRYKKNLKYISCEEDWKNVVTKLLPVGKNGILLNYLDPQKSIYLTSHIYYPVPYTKTVSFSQDDIKEEDFIDEEGALDEIAYYTALLRDLETQGERYLNENSVPKISYDLKANLENITDIGDKVTVIHEPLNLKLEATIISYDYDCILGKYTELKFGNVKKTLDTLLSDINDATNANITEQTNRLQTEFSSDIITATNEIWSILDDSYVVYQGDKLFIVDSLPKEQASKVIKFDRNGVSVSKNGIYGTFNTIWNIKNELDFNEIEQIKWGYVDLGKGNNTSGLMRLYTDRIELFAQFSNAGIVIYCSGGTYVKSNRDYIFSVYDNKNKLIAYLKNGDIKVKTAEVTDELKIGDNLRFLPKLDGVGIYKGVTN